MNMKKQLVCMAALCLVALQACEENRVYLWSGTCGAEGDGSNLTWELVGTRSDYDHDPQACTLTISGQGEMADGSPWRKEAIVRVFLEPGMTNIGDEAFYRCYDLTSITIPESVTNIGEWAFGDCQNLEEITVRAAIPPSFVVSPFYGVDKDIPVYVPANSINAYINSDWGKVFRNFFIVLR